MWGCMKNNIVYSSLLHDIGKLIMRSTGERKAHSYVGSDYLEKIGFEEEILLPIKYHHIKNLKQIADNLPLNSDVFIVYEADNISSAMDRRDDISQSGNDEEWRADIALKTIFSSFKAQKDTTSYYYPLRDLNPQNDINYPTETIYASCDKYQNLKKILDEKLNKDLNVNSLLELLESIMTYIPSSTNTKQNADISLFDHSKTTAAIAHCMKKYFEENNISDLKTKLYLNPNRDEKYFLLLSADISGIQDFIYTISSKGALKSLRARSFYLEILLEHIVDELCEKLELTRANLLYTGGGHFYMLLPNTNSTKEIIKEAENKINQWFLDEFGIDLYIAFAYEEACSNDLINTKNLFKNLTFKLSEKKQKRYNDNLLKQILKPQEIKSQRECTICNTSSKTTKEYISSLGEVCENCYNLFLAGKSIISDNMIISVTDYKVENSLNLPSVDDCKKYLSFKKIDSAKRYYVKNQRYMGENYATNLFVGDYNYRINKDEPANFSTLTDNSKGIKRLASLRCDVDNLGLAFISGFSEKYSTISRITSLSRQLSLFFKFYINKICEGNIKSLIDNDIKNFYIDGDENKEKKLAIIYSGGDDVFVVGAWIDVLNFAVDLRNAFKKYTCSKLTFSAGIGLFSSDYPISQIANQTGELEDYAKKYDNETKNSISLFGFDKDGKNNHTYHWDEFIDKTLTKVNILNSLCSYKENEQNKILFSTSMMYKFKQLLSSDEKGINIARFAYTLSRMLPSSSIKNTLLESNISKLKTNLYKWATEDKKSFLTALDLLIYINRNED